MKYHLLLLATAVSLAASPALASTITFHFGTDTATGLPGNEAVFGTGSAIVLAFGNFGLNPHNLIQKNSGGDEVGLGLDGSTDDEINAGESIDINVQHLVGLGIQSGTFTLGSFQTGENAIVCPGTACLPHLAGTSSGFGTVTVDWGTASNVTFFTTSGNYLVNALSVQTPVTTPEPPSFLLLGTALLGLALVARRRFGTVA